MKKTDLRQKKEPGCDDDALEVKNAMLWTALLAETDNHKATDVNPEGTDRNMTDNLNNHHELH